MKSMKRYHIYWNDKILLKELEEEVTLVGNNLRSLEISEGKATEREESYDDKIRTLTQQLEDVSNNLSQGAK